MKFTSSIVAFKAVIREAGVTIGQMALRGQDIRAGLLVPFFDMPVRCVLAYCARRPTERPPDCEAQTLLDCLHRAVRAGEAGGLA